MLLIELLSQAVNNVLFMRVFVMVAVHNVAAQQAVCCDTVRGSLRGV